MALLILIGGVLAALRTPVDIFPEVRIRSSASSGVYRASADEVSGRILTPFQRALTTTVNDIEHLGGNSYSGIGIVNLLRADRRHPHGECTGHRDFPDPAAADADRHHAALILNFNASTVPTSSLRSRARLVRAEPGGSCDEFDPHSAGHRARRRRAVAVRRQDAADPDRYRRVGSACSWPGRARCCQCLGRPEPDEPG